MQHDAKTFRSELRIATSRRYWRRANESKPWWPGGFMPLIGLAVLFLFGALFTAPRIEADVRKQVSHRIAATGVEVTSLSVNGQHVRIAAYADADAAHYLQAIAKVARCDTWAGRLTCPTVVDLSISEPRPPSRVKP